MDELAWLPAEEIAAQVRSRAISARAVTEAALARSLALNPRINAFTDPTPDRALAEAEAVDSTIAQGQDPGPLAGVPFAVKNLFDVAGLPTRAGSKINRDRPPAAQDAVLVQRMRRSGAVLIGALNMGEYAYDFTGENAHDGACCNPHDTARMSGGSSSGCGAATSAGLAPISLGSDTNGSIRVPAALCGVFSLKPTYGRLPRTGTFSFVDSLDHLGPFARTAGDLAAAYDALQGHDASDHASAKRGAEPARPYLDAAPTRLRVGLPAGWLADQMGPEAAAALDQTAETVKSNGASLQSCNLDGAEAGRAAAYLITNAESSAFHLDRLRARLEDFDPDTRDRFLAGALLPAAWLVKAQRARAWWLARALEIFDDVDALLVPATPYPAPLRGQKTLEINGREVPLRPTLGLMAQPFSCIGLPVVTVPVFEPGKMPLGIQIITPPWREALALQIARKLEQAGIAVAHAPPLAALARSA